MEFRAFVPNGEITAFLQDFDHLYFTELEGGVIKWNFCFIRLALGYADL
jgi:hypothetical protein